MGSGVRAAIGVFVAVIVVVKVTDGVCVIVAVDVRVGI